MNDIERARLEVYLEQMKCGLLKVVEGALDSIRAHALPHVPFPVPRDREHELKTWPEYFNGLWSGMKRAELRKTDRDFKVGDTLLLQEYELGPSYSTGRYTGRWVRARIIRIDEFEQAIGLALLSLEFIARGSCFEATERHPCALASEVAQDGHGADLGRLNE